MKLAVETLVIYKIFVFYHPCDTLTFQNWLPIDLMIL